MNKRYAILLFFTCCFILHTTATVIPTTNKQRLNEGWQFIRQNMGSIWEVMRPFRAGQPESVPLWNPVTLPHCFNAGDAVDPDVNYYQGAGWYKTLLSIDNPYPNGRILLEFEGAGQRTDVYIYTTKVGSHIGGYDGWAVDITDAVAAFSQTKECLERFKGQIPIAIRCDNTRDTGIIPSDMSDFNLYGGIYRYLNLVYVPEVSFQQIKITPTVDEKGKTGNLSIETLLYNPENIQGEGRIGIKVNDPTGKEILNQNHVYPLSGSMELANLTLKHPALWNVDDPQLYTCEIELEVNNQILKAVDKFGFRHFEFKEKGPFYLNGKRVLLKGTHRHEDHAGLAAALTEDVMRQEMQLIKDMGANFIRLGHYQQSDIVLRLCDELGILVWEEIPWCRGGLGGEAYQQQARNMLTNMIEQHYNHPSIILWGMGNENDWPGDFEEFDKEAIRTFMKELHNLSHQLDDTRLTAIRRCEFCKDIIDVYAPSIWAGWYSRKFTDYREMNDNGFNGTTRFFHAEWGGDSHAGRHNEGDYRNVSNAANHGDWSESYMIRLFDWHLKEQETMPNLTGAAFWTFKDFSTPLRPENPIPYVNQKGVTERDLTLKESYYVFQSYWATKPMIHIYGHTWPVRWGDENEEKEVLVYSNCPEAELFVNGVSFGKKKRNSQDFPAAGLRWYIPFNEGENTIKAVGYYKKEHFTDEITQEYQTAKWAAPARIRLSSAPINDNEWLITAELLDANGIRCLDSQEYIEFDIAGDAKMIDNQGTSTGSRKVQAYNGRACIKIAKKEKFTVNAHIYAKTNKTPTEFISIFAKN